MKILILCLGLAALMSCDSATTVEERKMTIAPRTLFFGPSDSVMTLSITHNCTCPFHWNGVPVDSTNTLIAFSGNGDNTAKEVSIMRANLQTDTLRAYWLVNSNYGTDTVRVTVIR